MRAELERALHAAKAIPPQDLPRLIGELEEICWTAKARLNVPQAASDAPDSLLGVREAAVKLGMSQDYLYRHAAEFPFTRRMGRALRFSSAGIEKYLRSAK
jgi:predicted DNA-binding transcriptional regulator AlpA